jgi:hypothetical protein
MSDEPQASVRVVAWVAKPVTALERRCTDVEMKAPRKALLRRVIVDEYFCNSILLNCPFIGG